MIDIIIATHGNLAEGLKDAVSLVVGEQENLECIGLDMKTALIHLLKM